MSRTHPLDPVKPGLALGRLAAGAVGGTVGGLVFGVMMLTDLIVTESLHDTGMSSLIGVLIGTADPMRIWAAHAAMSIAFGVIFGALISPHSYRSSVLWGLGYATALWALAALVLLRVLTGAAIAFDAAAAFSLVGHLLFGLALGIVYVAFHNLEIREALDAQSAKWRAWGEREKDA